MKQWFLVGFVMSTACTGPDRVTAPDAAIAIGTDDAAMVPPDVQQTVDAMAAAPVLGDVGNHGLVFSHLAGTRGTVLCFHGAGGSAQGWTSGDKRSLVDGLIADGYSIVCPTSVDRVSKQWSSSNMASNADVTNIDSLLATLGVSAASPLFLIGHSNGGGFTARFALLSSRTAAVHAIQVSNAAGLAQAMSLDAYVFPTLFNYADCDPVVAADEVRANIALLASKEPAVPTFDNDLDQAYASGTYTDCHQFVATRPVTAGFFAVHGP